MAQALAPESSESFVIQTPIASVWKVVRALQFDQLLPDIVSNCEGSGASPGATREVRYRDGSVTTLELQSVSDTRHAVSWKSTVPKDDSADAQAEEYTAIDTIELSPITTKNTTFVHWTTAFECVNGNLPASLKKTCRSVKRSFVWHLRRALKPIPPRPSIGDQIFYNDLHQRYVESLGYKTDSFSFWATDHLRMSGIYWGMAAMSLMNAETRMDTKAIVAWVLSCQNKDGGFGGNLGHDSHILYALSAVQILAICNAEHHPRFDRDGCARYVAALQQPDGSFFGDKWGEVDTRFSYCGLSCLSLLGKLDLIDVPKAAQFVSRCHNLDGGFGAVPGAESHAGQIFTCVGALAIAHSLDLIDADALGWWLCERQVDSGGLNGRPEKQADVCYSWWVLSSLAAIGRIGWINEEKLADFIVRCQDDIKGGIADRPDDEVRNSACLKCC